MPSRRAAVVSLAWSALVLSCSRAPHQTRSPSGVVTELVRAGEGRVHPRPNDCVRVRYTSRTMDGALQATSEHDPEPTTLCLRTAMPGLAEALQLMVAGEERRISLPAKLTHHSNEPTQLAPQRDLQIVLGLLQVLRAPETPSDLLTPPANAQRTASGLAFRVLTAGQGERRSLPAERLRVRLSGWNRRGELFESTELSGRPASLTRAEVAPGVAEGLALMRVGEKARLWLPAALAFGDSPRRGLPAGGLTYDVELIAVE